VLAASCLGWADRQGVFMERIASRYESLLEKKGEKLPESLRSYRRSASSWSS